MNIVINIILLLILGLGIACIIKAMISYLIKGKKKNGKNKEENE
ncbi:hypothetical protein [Peromfec virus RodF8_36]|uniref:Uncharacterized protein n=1 Tax=Peromfec virus RodF8_36 TaxID=2929371 RepID=A0A976N0T3_9VIRU|nr:hypothetical protein [Peromfec virus RodF8_36]